MFPFSLRPNCRKLLSKRDVKGLIRALRYWPDWRIRSDAAQLLATLSYSKVVSLSEAVGPLIDRLADRVPEVRVSAAQTLGEIGDSKALAPLSALLEDKGARLSPAARIAIEAILRTRPSVTGDVWALLQSAGARGLIDETLLPLVRHETCGATAGSDLKYSPNPTRSQYTLTRIDENMAGSLVKTCACIGSNRTSWHVPEDLAKKDALRLGHSLGNGGGRSRMQAVFDRYCELGGDPVILRELWKDIGAWKGGQEPSPSEPEQLPAKTPAKKKLRETVNLTHEPRPPSMMHAFKRGQAYAAAHPCSCGGTWKVRTFDSPMPGGTSGMPCVCSNCDTEKVFVFWFW